MGKVITKDNFRVIIEPKGLGDYGSVRVSDSMFHKTPAEREKAYERRCKEIMEQVKRHVDEVQYVHIDYDAHEHCSFCGYVWDIDEQGVPLCCDEAVLEHEKLTPTHI